MECVRTFFFFQHILEIRKLSKTMRGLWFPLSAPAKIPHLAFPADLSPLRPEGLHLWVLSEAAASLTGRKQTFGRRLATQTSQ